MLFHWTKAKDLEIMMEEGTGHKLLRFFLKKEKKNIYFCFIDYAKAFDGVDHSKLWQVLKEMGVPDHLVYLLRNLYSMWDKKQQLELDMEQLIGSTLGKEYDKAVYCPSAYLTYMQNTGIGKGD